MLGTPGVQMPAIVQSILAVHPAASLANPLDRSDLAPRSNWLNGRVAARASEVRGRIQGRRADARVAVFAAAMVTTENCLTSDLGSAA